MGTKPDEAVASFKLSFPTDPNDRRELIKALAPVILKIKEDALERSRKNAPIRSGKLRKSLYVQPEINITNGTISFNFGSPLSYALAEHEQDHQLGPISMEQSATEEGGVGKKYFTRVIDARFSIWDAWLAEAYLTYVDKKLKKGIT